jgi:hypothetical protein
LIYNLKFRGVLTRRFSRRLKPKAPFRCDRLTSEVGVVDPTNPVPGQFYRVVAQVDQHGKFSFTKTNAYSGNNGRAAILNNNGGANLFYTSGNAGNGGNPQPAGVIVGAGAQILTAANKPLRAPSNPASEVTGPRLTNDAGFLFGVTRRRNAQDGQPHTDSIEIIGAQDDRAEAHHALAPDLVAAPRQKNRHLPRPVKRRLQILLVDQTHQFKIGGAHGLRLAIHGGTRQLQ